MSSDFRPFTEPAFLLVLALVVGMIAIGGGVMWWFAG
jgi:hypothetical protein